MSWYNTYWNGLISLVAAAWPEVQPGAVAVDTTAERRDWINLLNAKQLALPFVIVKLNITEAEDWVPDWPCYNVEAVLNYVADTKLPPGAREGTITEYLMSRLLAMSSAAMWSASIGTVLTQPELSLNADNPVNISLLDAQVLFQSASVIITSVIVDMGNL